MPIGDLLASITGEKPKTADTPRNSLNPKRKADEDLRNAPDKFARTASATNVVSAVSYARAAAAAATVPPSAASTSRPAYQGTSDPNRRTAASNARPSTTVGRGSLPTQRTKPVSGPEMRAGSKPGVGPRPTSSTVGSTGAPLKAAPKKGSFAEIMARAAKAQQSQGPVGRIQHKAVEKPQLIRQRTEPKSDTGRGAATNGRDGSKARAAPSKSKTSGSVGPSRYDDKANGRLRSPGASGARPAAVGKKETTAAIEAKKVKKAAVATTGYQGTARPKLNGTTRPGQTSGSAASSRDSDRRRTAGLSGTRDYRARQNRYSDDEDMDDFIDYDDEEDEIGYGRPRYTGASEDDESDMEAGLSDIDEEENRAAVLGRREDREQEALEQRLKLAKEERKRRLLETVSSRR